ncbi:MAG: 30S ribosomal protein S20 [Deltaproteobacteria bacterium]|nr:30S ribosomal protein S20 [Deltaproteobacteria bacterium]
MAKHLSVIKRHHQSLVRRERNQQIKSRVKTLIKKVRSAVEPKDRDNASAQLREVNRIMDKAVSRGVLKHKTASRKLSRLARRVHLLKVES